MEREIHWYTLGGSAQDAEFTAAAMKQLLARLRQELPGLTLETRELRGDLLDVILPHLGPGNLDGTARAIEDAWGTSGPGVLSHVTVYCPDEAHPAVRAARRKLAHAAWGISLSGILSLTYALRNPYALWHESLHLLGAQDHYDQSSFRTTCAMATCLMQYAPSETTVGPRPFICDATASILRRACA